MSSFRSLLSLILLLALSVPGSARDWFVSPSGNDSSEGTEQAPLRTVQAALNRAQAGDVCQLRQGTYREVAEFKTSGSASQPVRLTAFSGEAVILDGTDAVHAKWEKHQGSIYQTVAPKGIEQLFIGREMMNRGPLAQCELCAEVQPFTLGKSRPREHPRPPGEQGDC